MFNFGYKLRVHFEGGGSMVLKGVKSHTFKYTFENLTEYSVIFVSNHYRQNVPYINWSKVVAVEVV